MQPRNHASTAILAKAAAQATGGGGGGQDPAAGAGARTTLVLPAELLDVDICVIGAGSGGISVAAAAAAFGQKVVLIEKHKMGGECLNYGCVPSKALLAAARRAHHMRTADRLGISSVTPAINHRAVHDHVQSVIAAIAPNDSMERLTGLGVTVILGTGRFIDRRTVEAGEHRITARRFVIATGSSPLVPPITGLDNVAYFTNETIFSNKEKLERLIVVGGGPVGLELAQAYHRLGSRVTVLESVRVLGRDDPELTAVVRKRLVAEGIDVREGTNVERVEAIGGGVRAHTRSGGIGDSFEGTHILIAAGRRPNHADLNLDAAGVKHDERGITVDAGLRTSNRRVFAIGDVTGGLQYTHVADYQAGIVIRRALFRLPAKAKPRMVPWVTFTDPELAHVGLTEDQARAQRYKINVLRWSYHENDRAQAEKATEGHIKVVTDRKGLILGATIAGAQAGEVVQTWSLAISQGLNIRAMTEWIAPYPTFGGISKRVALRYFSAAAGNPFIRRAIRMLAKLG